jgi:hypothetical protein
MTMNAKKSLGCLGREILLIFYLKKLILGLTSLLVIKNVKIICTAWNFLLLFFTWYRLEFFNINFHLADFFTDQY